MTNLEFAKWTARVSRVAASWTADTLAIGDELLGEDALNDSRERFYDEIKGLLDRMQHQS